MLPFATWLRYPLVAVRRRKKRTIDVGKEARRVARKSGLAPAVTRVIPDKKKKPEKHKKRWLEIALN